MNEHGAIQSVKPQRYLGNEVGLIRYWPLVGSHGNTTGVGPAELELLQSPREGAAEPHAGTVVPSPWQEENTRATAWFQGNTCHLHTACTSTLSRQSFTWEGWVYWPQCPQGAQTLLQAVTYTGQITWLLGLDHCQRLHFRWADDNGDSRAVRSVSMADLIPAHWYHFAVAFTNRCYTAQPYVQSYSRVELFFTPAGELFPRSVALERDFAVPQVSGHPMQVHIGSGRDGSPVQGRLCGIACTGHAKLRNEFAALGQRMPDRISVRGDFPQGSVHCPIARGCNALTVAGQPQGDCGNYWFYGLFEVPTNEVIDLEILVVPGGEGMMVALWQSYDRVHWERVPGGYLDQMSRTGDVFRVRHSFAQSPVYVAASIPYTNEDVARLADDIRSDPRARIFHASQSVDGRTIPLMCITDPAVPNSRKRAIYVQTGQHSPMEMIAGRSCEQAIRHLLTPTRLNRARLNHVVYLFVPIVNVDAAHYGTTAPNRHGVNLNRDWQSLREPETRGLSNFIEAWVAGGQPLDAAIDFHAGGGWATHTILARDRQELTRCGGEPLWEEQERLIDCIDRWMEIKRSAARYPPARGDASFSGAMPRKFRIPALTIELGVLTHHSLDGDSRRPVDQAHIERLGVQLLQALDEYFEVPGRLECM